MWQGRKQRGRGGFSGDGCPGGQSSGGRRNKAAPLHYGDQGQDAKPSLSALQKLPTPPLTLCPVCSLPEGGDPRGRRRGRGGDGSPVLGPLVLKFGSCLGSSLPTTASAPQTRAGWLGRVWGQESRPHALGRAFQVGPGTLTLGTEMGRGSGRLCSTELGRRESRNLMRHCRPEEASMGLAWRKGCWAMEGQGLGGWSHCRKWVPPALGHRSCVSA